MTSPKPCFIVMCRSTTLGTPRQRPSDALGRVYTVPPNNAECFFLRMLLHTVRGPTSFTDLGIVDDQICATFREVCQRRGLLEDDKHWNETIVEAAESQSAPRLRYLLAILLTTCGPFKPMELWENHKESLIEGILLPARRQNPVLELTYMNDMFNKALI